MNFISKGLNKLKANSIYKERGFDFDKDLTTVDDVNAFALAKKDEDKLLAFDYLLFNYYYSPCAYTASNLIAGYIDFYQSGEELTEGLPSFDFIDQVGRYLEKASKVVDVFDAKEYFITLAQFYLLQDSSNLDRPFKLLNSIPTAYIDEDAQYLTGTLYFLLGMKDIALKMLEGSIHSTCKEIKASSALLLVKCGYGDDNKKVELLTTALDSTKTAILTETCAMLMDMGKGDIVAKVDIEKLIPVMNGELCKVLATTYKLSNSVDKLTELENIFTDDELYTSIISGVKNSEEVDVDDLSRKINQKHIEEIAESEMYKTADSYTRRMLNNEIMETAIGEDEFSELDYIVLCPAYLK